MEQGRGPPSYFITLSCAEYHWEDVKQLLMDRFRTPGLNPPADMQEHFIKNVNLYTVHIQEYFQLRVKYWLETVGRTFLVS